jgi:hypothetical protein
MQRETKTEGVALANWEKSVRILGKVRFLEKGGDAIPGRGNLRHFMFDF